MNKIRKHQSAILLGLLFTFLMYGLINPSNELVKTNLQKVEGLIYDFRLNATLEKHPRNNEHNIFIVDIDEKALNEVGRWPWSRATVAQLVTKLQDAGVIVVGFDVVFSEPEVNPVDKVDSIGGLEDLTESQKQELRFELDADQRFAESMEEYDVVLGGLLQLDKTVNVGTLKPSVVKMLDPNAVRVSSMSFEGKVTNIDKLQQAAIGQGFFNSVPDVDGAIRRSALVFEHKGLFYPSLSAEVARVYKLQDYIEVETEPSEAFRNVHDVTAVKFGASQRIPTDAYGRVLVPFRGGRESFPYYSAADILFDRLDPELLDAGVALVGTSSVGIADLRETSVGIQYPGVEVHANVLEGLLRPELFSFRPDYWQGVTAAQVIGLGLLLSIWLPLLGPGWMAMLGTVGTVFVVTLNYYMWSVEQVDLPVIQPLLTVFAITIFNISRGFFFENANKQQIKSMFDQYVPPAHIDQMLTDPSSASLKGERKEMSVLFSDIRNFTSISERLSANDLKDMLNEYFSPITKNIFEHNGTIDKYVGDMVMAFWGAPLDNPKHAEQAVLGGFDMLEITARLRDEFVKKDWPAVRIGIGINTGDMNVGDMGSEYRRAYTVLGDAVNLGSRLEGLTKAYGLEFLVSEFTKEQCPNIAFRPVDKVKVKGKDIPVAIFEPVCQLDDLDDETQQEIEDLNVAYNYYLTQAWSEAEGGYRDLQQRFPERFLYQLFLERIEHLREQDLGEDWDGSFTHTSK